MKTHTKKLALVVYPYFSLQEIANLCHLFKWYYDTETEVFAADLEEVRSEEGIWIKPQKTYSEFRTKDYDCVILSGCSDFRSAIRDEKLEEFLSSLKSEDIIIGAICAGPLFLAKAGLLEGKEFTNSLFVEMNRRFKFIEEDNHRYAPVVVAENIITAVGEAYNEFAIAVARKVGYECSNNVLSGVPTDWKPEDFKYHLPAENLKIFEDEFKEFLIKNH